MFWRLLALVVAGALQAPTASAQPHDPADRYDDTFRKAAKRSFGPAFDWRLFKAQGMAESNLDPMARSRVGARGLMQLMPSTYREIASENADLALIDNPELNIEAGIAYDRRLWLRWENDSIAEDRRQFMFASYNAGRGTLLNAQRRARQRQLDPRQWRNIEKIAASVPRWRHLETLDYVRKIEVNIARLDDRGRIMKAGATARGLKR
ncbi:transglycosylase SLT domain-containing protein [Gemmatimonas sp.]|uniref:transglycosylase SLT domain-containing protein n=1 Tax=Gemmatimonas sp. TaxID=1962908 RepID=UPI00286E682A|nr:transglycosylase SLT domain-containing protein [Gemmatimonas sp.]